MTIASLKAACRAERARVREAETRAELLSSQLAVVEKHLTWRASLNVITDLTLLDAETLDHVTHSWTDVLN